MGDEEPEDEQITMMREWFYGNYENPAERTPYESAEGGYIWIWGGPFDAHEVLDQRFGGEVDDELIGELAHELSDECSEWAPAEQEGDYDEYFVDDVVSIPDAYSNFIQALQDIEALAKVQVEDNLKPCFYRMLFVNVVTALETYLSDTFITKVIPNEELKRKFVESNPDFQQEKIHVSDIYKAVEGLNQKVNSYLADVVWHHLHRVRPMYEAVLDVSLPEIGDLMKAVLTRHDIVHRNGKTKSGADVTITMDNVSDLAERVRKFVDTIDAQIKPS